METVELINALRKSMVETGSLICIGCGWEHNCSTHGCAIMREAADALEQLNRRTAPENKPLTLEQLRQIDVPAPFWLEEVKRGDMKCSKIEPVLFNGIKNCNEAEKACWATSQAHYANIITTAIKTGIVNFYSHKPEKSEQNKRTS